MNAQQSVREPMALYRLDVEMHFAGPIPERYNRAAPEVSAAHREAVEAAQEVMRRHGFLITNTGHGSLRTGTHLPTDAQTGRGERDA
jgi:hypothetical protein